MSEPGFCTQRIDSAGLPNRGEAILERERFEYPVTTNELSGELLKGEAAEWERPFTVDDLVQAAAGEWMTVEAAAWLAGRCEPPVQSDAPRLNALLHDLLDTRPFDPDLGTTTRARIEASMSLALRGEVDAGHELLVPMATDRRRQATAGWRAANYLAQMGDASGWPVIVDGLEGDDEHTRLMSARQLIAFVAFAGTTVDGLSVDPRARLVAALADSSPWVAVEIPGLLAEARVDGVEELLAKAARDSRLAEARDAAATVLEQLRLERQG